MNVGSDNPIDPEILEALQERMALAKGPISLEAFIECALYHPQAGYYCRNRQRVGRRADADFYTASSLGEVFSRLVLASIENLLEDSLKAYSFVELGPESPRGILGALPNAPFRERLQLRAGDTVRLPQKAVVFSNEVFDAQPFRRFVSRKGRWMEMGVTIGKSLQWVEMEPVKELPLLPEANEGYLIDWPEQALQLLQTICQEPWNGLFIAFDYGLEKSTPFKERPMGTGRTYASHTLGDDLLAQPGLTDITCHLVWDDMEQILRDNGFANVRVHRQEAFFMHHGSVAMRHILETAGTGFSAQKQTLMELLHPDNMGHKFQVLSGRRGDF